VKVHEFAKNLYHLKIFGATVQNFVATATGAQGLCTPGLKHVLV
jgi:hypothetical protein